MCQWALQQLQFSLACQARLMRTWTTVRSGPGPGGESQAPHGIGVFQGIFPQLHTEQLDAGEIGPQTVDLFLESGNSGLGWHSHL